MGIYLLSIISFVIISFENLRRNYIIIMSTIINKLLMWNEYIDNISGEHFVIFIICTKALNLKIFLAFFLTKEHYSI
jgi:NADH:ubiquinone oxidoreductase subunit K